MGLKNRRKNIYQAFLAEKYNGVRGTVSPVAALILLRSKHVQFGMVTIG
jgi:hypothetical protein